MYMFTRPWTAPLASHPHHWSFWKSWPRSCPYHVPTILLVEDNEDLRNLGQHVLESSGYQTLTTSYSREALDLAQCYHKPFPRRRQCKESVKCSIGRTRANGAVVS
jgi:hypothetical protein